MHQDRSTEPAFTRSPLDAVLRRHGATMAVRHGRWVAVHFGSAASEAAVCVKTVGICDRSDRATFEIHGSSEDVEDALAAINPLAGGACWTRITLTRAIVRCAHSDAAQSMAALDGATAARTAEISDRCAAIAVIGPFSVNLLRLANFGRAGGALLAPDGQPVVLYTGPDAFELLTDAADGATVWTRLLHAGAALGVACVGLDALEHLTAAGRMRPAVNPIAR